MNRWKVWWLLGALVLLTGTAAATPAVLPDGAGEVVCLDLPASADPTDDLEAGPAAGVAVDERRAAVPAPVVLPPTHDAVPAYFPPARAPPAAFPL